MEIIGITGGKGGTGKSTFALLLANELLHQGKKVILVDADVECPNIYLINSWPIGQDKKKVYAYFPELIKEKCQKCGLCAQKCPFGAIFQAPNQYPVFLHEMCGACHLCKEICPFGAIKEIKKMSGKIFLSEPKKNLTLITGKAKQGLEETGPVVKELIEFSQKIGKTKKADYLLIDSAAGTHCPVIHALLGVDKAMAVTEPTPLGSHDLKLIINLLQKLKKPVEIIINQVDLGKTKEIEEIAAKHNIPIKHKIPYSKKLVKQYAQGKFNLKLSDL
ncbi:P-loop NTPase [bacterium]|nr:P-loop NTPase [bacterium]